ncbi:MAG: MATE family efflux transporter [Deltaproteobacteria bacterium]|nr:MATE family efflux transporter [Deltaproteobacteria bacterium]
MENNNKEQKQYRSAVMGTEPIWPLLFKFSGPAIISMTVASTYNIVDAIFVGRLGAEALAALSVTYPLSLSFLAIAAGTGVGATSLISRYLGKGERTKSYIAASVAITLCLILSLGVILSCLPNMKPILKVLGAQGSVLVLAEEYISVQIKMILFYYLTMALGHILRAFGNPLLSSTVMVLSSIANIILDPLFIFGLGPIPAMGVKGAAVATVIAQILSSMIYLGYLFSKRSGYKFSAMYFIPHPKVVFEIYRIGFASIVRSGVQFLVMGVINREAAFHGVVTLALMGVLIRLGRFVQMPAIGIGQGLLPLIGYNYGARKMKRVKELVYKASFSGSIWSGFCWALIMIFPGHVLAAFGLDSTIVAEGGHAVRLYFSCIFIIGVQMVPGFFFQGMGRGLPASVLSAAKFIIFLLPLILVLTSVYGITGLWVSFPIADMLTFLTGLAWMILEFRKQGILKRADT